jgi:hypothetical protein
MPQLRERRTTAGAVEVDLEDAAQIAALSRVHDASIAGVVSSAADSATAVFDDRDAALPEDASDDDAPPSAHHVELPALRLVASPIAADVAAPLSQGIADAPFGPPLDETLAEQPELEATGEVKLEMATKYWDEMGDGRSHAVHTHLFHRLTGGLQLTAPDAGELPWQVPAGVNVMLWSCSPRRNAFRAQGTLGAVELLAPQRRTRLVHGALRVGISRKTMSY